MGSLVSKGILALAEAFGMTARQTQTMKRYWKGRGYGGNKIGKYFGFPRYSGDQEIARRAQKIREGKACAY